MSAQLQAEIDAFLKNPEKTTLLENVIFTLAQALPRSAFDPRSNHENLIAVQTTFLDFIGIRLEELISAPIGLPAVQSLLDSLLAICASCTPLAASSMMCASFLVMKGSCLFLSFIRTAISHLVSRRRSLCKPLLLAPDEEHPDEDGPVWIHHKHRSVRYLQALHPRSDAVSAPP